MRAAVCREFGAPLTIEEVTLGEAGAHMVVVDVAACAICHSDIAYMDGSWRGQLPAVYGHEAAGTVSGIGAEVTRFAPGDPVAVTLVRSCGDCYLCASGDGHLCREEFSLQREPPLRVTDTGEQLWQAMATGAFAEQVLVHESQLAPLPPAVPMTSAALLACGVVTGFGAVTKSARVPGGSAVVVLGVGGVGINCIQGAVHAGADPIIAVDLRATKLQLARRLGATAAIDGSASNPVEVVAGLTGGRGADYVFVAVGSSRAVESGLQLLRPGGTLVIVGLPPTGDLISFDPAGFASAGNKLIGSKMGSVTVAEDIPLLAAMYAAGELELDGLITNTYPLDRINEAVASARSGEAIRNVIVFD